MFKKLDKNGFYYGFPVLLMTTEDKESGKSKGESYLLIRCNFIIDNLLLYLEKQ